MPLFVHLGDELHHIGTAFLISRFGLFATASHCIMEALRLSGHSPDQFRPGSDYDLTLSDVRMSVLYTIREGDDVRFAIWSVEHIQMVPPTDVAYGSLLSEKAPKPVLAARLGFAIPTKGECVRAIGYPSVLPNPLPLARIKAGDFDWRTFTSTLVAVAGSVLGTTIQGHGNVRGPCVIADCPSEHGMSGGPVINEQGNVFGVVSGSAILEEGSGAKVSLFYPTLTIGLKLTWRPTPSVTFNYGSPLLTAIQQGLVQTDGTERLHQIAEDGERVRVDPSVKKSEAAFIFDTAADFCDGRPSKPLA